MHPGKQLIIRNGTPLQIKEGCSCLGVLKISRMANRIVVCFSPSSVDSSSHSEDQGGSLLCADGGSMLARKAMVPDLIRLIQGCPWQLPAQADLLSETDGQIWHPNPTALHLWVWSLWSLSLWLKYVSLKWFLLALCSAKQVGELCVLSVSGGRQMARECLLA